MSVATQQESMPSKFFKRLTTTELVYLAVMGVIFGVLGTPMAILFRFLNTAGGSYGWALSGTILGWFYLVGVLGAYIVRKPGAATIAEVISGFAQVLSGNPNGIDAILGTLGQGIGADLGFSIFGYRKFGTWPVILAGILSVPFGYIADAFFFGIPTTSWEYFAAAGVRAVSGLVFALIGAQIAKAVARTGALKGTALGRVVRR